MSIVPGLESLTMSSRLPAQMVSERASPMYYDADADRRNRRAVEILYGIVPEDRDIPVRLIPPPKKESIGYKPHQSIQAIRTAKMEDANSRIRMRKPPGHISQTPPFRKVSVESMPVIQRPLFTKDEVDAFRKELAELEAKYKK